MTSEEMEAMRGRVRAATAGAADRMEVAAMLISMGMSEAEKAGYDFETWEWNEMCELLERLQGDDSSVVPSPIVVPSSSPMQARDAGHFAALRLRGCREVIYLGKRMELCGVENGIAYMRRIGGGGGCTASVIEVTPAPPTGR